MFLAVLGVGLGDLEVVLAVLVVLELVLVVLEVVIGWNMNKVGTLMLGVLYSSKFGSVGMSFFAIVLGDHDKGQQQQ